jgi:membrane protease YdiL (CAAX protease family)
VERRRHRPVAEALVLLAITFPLAVWWHVPTLWLLVPFAVITATRRAYATYGLTWQRPGSLRWHAAVATGVFLPYALGHYALAHWWYGASFHIHLPADFAQSVIDQTLLIALPEEFFFRGYLQTQCDQVWGRPYRFLGAPCGVGIVIAAALFAVCHLTLGIGGLTRFFPGLWYGWLRARTDTIAVPVAYHAASNLLMQVMLASLSI